MRTREDIEAYLIRSGHPHREVAENTWLVSDPSDLRDHVVLRVVDDLVIFRMKILELPTIDPKRREAFFELLLRLNAEEMIHGAYGIEDSNLVMVATLRLSHLDYNEFSGTLDDFALAISNHHGRIAEFRTAA
ncbi:MAG: YbjN domain-containing protein [Sandaracinaceae bacterium]|nr:YbjN domain-containing protein [Sandaracinaceae bacterium]